MFFLFFNFLDRWSSHVGGSSSTSALVQTSCVWGIGYSVINSSMTSNNKGIVDLLTQKRFLLPTNNRFWFKIRVIDERDTNSETYEWETCYYNHIMTFLNFCYFWFLLSHLWRLAECIRKKNNTMKWMQLMCIHGTELTKISRLVGHVRAVHLWLVWASRPVCDFLSHRSDTYDVP